jgi:hypothetical protein
MDSTVNTVYYDLTSAVRQLTDSVAAKAKTDLCIDIHDRKSFIVTTVIRVNKKLIAICSRHESPKFASKNDVYYDCSLDSVLRYYTNSKPTCVSDIIHCLRSSNANVIISIYEFTDKRLKLTDRYIQIESLGSPKDVLGDIIILSE